MGFEPMLTKILTKKFLDDDQGSNWKVLYIAVAEVIGGHAQTLRSYRLLQAE